MNIIEKKSSNRLKKIISILILVVLISGCADKQVKEVNIKKEVIKKVEETETPKTEAETIKEKIAIQSKLEIPESAQKLEFGYGTTGAWNIPLGYLQKNRNDWK